MNQEQSLIALTCSLFIAPHEALRLIQDRYSLHQYTAEGLIEIGCYHYFSLPFFQNFGRQMMGPKYNFGDPDPFETDFLREILLGDRREFLDGVRTLERRVEIPQIGILGIEEAQLVRESSNVLDMANYR